MDKGHNVKSGLTLVQNSETALTDVEDENIEAKTQTEIKSKENSNELQHDRDEKLSSIDSWMAEWNLMHLKEDLVKQDLYSIEKLQQLALDSNFEEAVAKMVINNNNLQANDKLKLIHGCNALLLNHLGNTNDFLSKLKQLCQTDKIWNKSKNDQEWVLILVDGDDIGLLLQNKQISLNEAQNSINLLNANICRIIHSKDNNNNNDIFGYHLGSDLFSLFVYDNKNTMKKSIEIVQYLLDVMRNKNKSSFTISVGMGIRQTMIINDDNKSNNDEEDAIQREWVLRAHINLLRAKENGKNCFFNLQNDIDSSKDNKELLSLTAKINQLYDDLYIDECGILIDELLKKFDQETIINQTITTKHTKSMRSVYLTKAWIVFSRKGNIGNNVYRVNAAKELMKLSLKTFILGKMSIECYYYYKVLKMEIEQGLQQENRIPKTQSDNHNNHSEKYDVTLLTQRRKADDVISCVTKNTSMYYGKQAYEHVKNISDACVPRILIGFANHVDKLGEQTYEYQEKLYQQVIELDKDCSQSLCRINLANILWEMKKYGKTLQFIESSIESFPNNSRLLYTAAAKYKDSCMSFFDEKMKKVDKDKIGLNKDERLDKALEYGQKMVDSAHNEGQWISRWMYLFYGSLLYAWSKDFDKNKEQQVTALKMYEKGIKLDQQFGYDIINNWIRVFDKFEHELVNTIVDYWYYPDKSMQKYTLDCADLIETYFNQNEQKMKRAKLLSGLTPLGFIRTFSTSTASKPTCYYIAIKKPSIYDKMLYTRGKMYHLRSFIASWKLDVGGAFVSNNSLETENSTSNSSTIEFGGAYAAKLAYFFAFWQDYKDFIVNELRLTIDMVKQIRIVMIQILIHYAFRLQKKEHKNFIEMIKDSFKMQLIFAMSDIQHAMKLEELSVICDKIEKHINLEDEQIVLNMSKIIHPYIVTKNNRIESLNGQDMSILYSGQFKFKNNEMLCCLLQIIGLGNPFTNINRFQYWDTSATSLQFRCALVCCVLQMLFHISNEN